MQHGAEFRRCLLELDVYGIIAVHEHTAPYAPRMSPADTLVAMHMARVDAKTFGFRIRQYSVAWLRDHGFEKANGRWRRTDAAAQAIFAEAVGISSASLGGHQSALNHEIMNGMTDALRSSLAKGVMEPEMQREAMLKARARIRFKKRI